MGPKMVAQRDLSGLSSARAWLREQKNQNSQIMSILMQMASRNGMGALRMWIPIGYE